MKTRTVAGAGAAIVGAAGLVTFLVWPPAPHEVAMQHVLETVPAENICRVTTLADSGPGSLRNCIVNRAKPHYVVFADLPAGGTIVAKMPIKIELPFLTIDGSTAPAPGITYLVSQEGGIGVDPEIKIAATHDVVIHGIRFDGTWDPSKATKNTAVLAVDGDAGANVVPWDPNPYACAPEGSTNQLYLRNSCNIVIDQNTFSGGADANPDFWSGVKNLTFSRNLLIDNHSPRSTGSDTIGLPGDPKARERITEYANVFAHNEERQPNLREGIYDYDFINNILAFWPTPGYASRWDDDGSLDRHNVMANVWLALPTTEPLDSGCIFGDVPKYDVEDLLFADGLHFEGNVHEPKHNPNECVSTATGQARFQRPYSYDGTGPGGLKVWEPNQLEAEVLDKAGAPHKTAREQQVIEEVRVALRAALGQPGPSPSSPPPSTPTPSGSSPPPPPPTTLPPPGGTRYVDPVFPSVKVTSNIVYSQPVTSVVGVTTALKLDLYEPLGDTAMNRIGIQVIHGGSLCGGSKGDNGIKELAEEYARRGFVATSINYRLKTICWPDPDPLLSQAASDAHSDSAAAVRWLRKNAATYRVDPTRVMVAGFSAGATSSFWLAYNTEVYTDPTKNTNPSNPGFSSETSVAILVGFSSAGAGAKIQPGEITPVINFYGANDSYYNTYGKPLKQALDAAGIVNEIHVFPGWGHDFLKNNRPTSPPLVATKSGSFILSKVLAP